jgi:GNAT superfamily N-acetyltransferase
VALVAECREDGPHEYAPVGFAHYTVFRGRIVLSRLAVAPDVRGRGVGRQLLAEVQRRTATHFVSRVTTIVPESDLSALQFARACGAKAVGLLRGYFATEDGIELVLLSEIRHRPQLAAKATSVPNLANGTI